MDTPDPHDHRHTSWHLQPDTGGLPCDSFTAQKLQHATPEHLHLTSRRLFIGPIPTAWLTKHRRDSYRHHLRFNYSNRAASFSEDPRENRRRRLSGLEGPSTSALFRPSFPQPVGVELGTHSAQDSNAVGHSEEGEDVGLTSAATSSDNLPASYSTERQDDLVVGTDGDNWADVTSDTESENTNRPPTAPRRPSAKSFTTASSSQPKITERDEDEDINDAARQRDDHKQDQYQSQSQGQVQGQIKPNLGQTDGAEIPTETEAGPSATQRSSTAEQSRGASASPIDPPSMDIESTSSLIPQPYTGKNPPPVNIDTRTPPKGILARVKRRSTMAFSNSQSSSPVDDPNTELVKRRSNLRNLVRFDIPEDSKRATVHLKAKKAQMTIQRAGIKLRRRTIKDGIVIKMERMLVRVDATAGSIPEDFDENANQKVDSRIKEKWREYMVVCRHSHSDDAEFLLQFYKTRVIPEIDRDNNSKKPSYQVTLGRKTSKVNLYSALDKSIVVSQPVHKGSLIFIMQARTASSASEWYTFIRNVLGWRRSKEVQINVPDMGLSVRISNPFEKLEASQDKVQDAEDTEQAIIKTMEEEQAVTQYLIRRCLEQLQDAPEWKDILDLWIKDHRMGLAWKRYDRLEWIHGANERRMYGTIGMLKSHDLELRPKMHYPTSTVIPKKQKTLEEPPPVEGFLIRLTGQRGRAKRLGLMYHKQLYFATHDQFLVFSRPTKATPPPPPKLPVTDNPDAQRSQVIPTATPSTWDVVPYPMRDNQIEWLCEGHSGTPESRRVHDEAAVDEQARKEQNLLDCDGYINMANISRIRKAVLGASPVDQDIESGSDVDFEEEVDMDSRGEDGATSELDVQRTFELVMKNGLVIRLQAADKDRRKDWMRHLRALAKYWRHRTAADIALYKSIRARNLSALKIDEEGEAHIGQFARKWETTQSFASPQLYNLCGIASCRSIHMSGILYRKPRIHAPFTRCSVLLTGGTLVMFADVLRSSVGKRLEHIHHERIANLDLRDCYVYSGLVTESDLLYSNQTFDANKPGHHALPRIYLDGWTSTDEDVMTTFVIWHGKAKSWFRAEEGAGGGEQAKSEGKRIKLKRVAKLGSKGRAVVFRARSRAERDHWVLAVQNEIERVQGDGADFRFEETMVDEVLEEAE